MPWASTPSPYPLKVLVVDDEHVLANEVVEVLTASGFDASATYDGTTALAILASSPDIGILVTDIRLPRFRGADFIAQALATRTDQQALMVVAMTGDGTAETKEMALRAGAATILLKPFALTELLDGAEGAMALAIARRGAASSAT